MASLGASTAFAAEILGNRLISLSLARSAQAAFKPMVIFSKKNAASAKAKPVVITLASKDQKCHNNGPHRGIFLPNGPLDRDDIPEYLDGEVPDEGAAGFIIHEAFNEFVDNCGPEVGWLETWILDSGATYHMCPNKKWFDTFEETDDEGALMGDDTVCRVAGVGTVKMKMFDGIVRTLGDVRYIPALKKNIISLGTLDRLGYGFEGSRGELKVTKGSMVYMKGEKMPNNLYRLQCVTMVSGAAVSTQEDSKDTTHNTRIKGFSSGWANRKSTGFLKKRSKNVRRRF